MPLRSLLVALIATSVPAFSQAGPRDDLLRVVPGDYTFCVVVQNLREHAKGGNGDSFLPALANSPLIKQFKDSPEAKKIQQVIDTFLKDLNVTPEQFRDDLLGDALVFSYRKGPAGRPDAEDGLILLHARDEKLLGKLVGRINEIQKEAGELKAVESVEGKAGKYFKRVKAVEGEPADYYAILGHRLVFSGREELLVRCMAGLSDNDKGEPLIARQMKQLGVNDAPIACLINPRAFDGDLAESAKGQKGTEQTFLKEFAKYWKAVDGLAISLNLQPSLEIGISLNVRKKDMPKAAQTFFSEAAKRSPLWDKIPDDALFAAVGRLHPESMFEMMSAFMTREDHKKVLDSIADAARPFLESDDFAPLLRGIGPDFGVWITAPDATDKTWVPQGILAAKIARGPEGVQAEQAALKGLDFFARLACLSNKGLRIHTEMQGPITVRSLSHATAFPPGFKPAFASKGGYILVAGSPQTLARYEPPVGEATDATEVPLIRVSVAAWRTYLKAHRAEIGKFLAATKGIEPATFESQLDSILPILEGLDRMELVQRSGPDRATLILRFKEARK